MRGVRAMYSALEIAKWFLAENRVRMVTEDSEYITHLKLQKLLYYAQGCFLAIKDEPLFNEEIYAWQHGPVVPEVYDVYKCYNSGPIIFDEEYNINTIDADTKAVLKEVFDVFGQYTAWKLRNMTHNEAPWKETKQGDIISKCKMKSFFKAEYIE